jgi:hypothetical protein
MTAFIFCGACFGWAFGIMFVIAFFVGDES